MWKISVFIRPLICFCLVSAVSTLFPLIQQTLLYWRSGCPWCKLCNFQLYTDFLCFVRLCIFLLDIQSTWCIIQSFLNISLYVSVWSFDKYTVSVEDILFLSNQSMFTRPLPQHSIMYLDLSHPSAYKVYISVDIDTIYNDYWNFYLLQLSQWPYNGSPSTGWRSDISSQISVLYIWWRINQENKRESTSVVWSIILCKQTSVSQ